MRGLNTLPIAAAVLVAGCGGGGGGVNSAGSNPPAPGGGSTPVNTTIGDLRANQNFTNTASASQVAFDLTTRTTITGGVAPGALTVSYDAASKTYTVAAGGQSSAFAPGDIVGSADGETRYRKSTAAGRELLTLVTEPYTGTKANQYVGLGYWQRNVLTGSRQDTYLSTFTYGFETPASAVPRSGNISFTIDVFGLSATTGYEPRVFQGNGSFVADLMSGVFHAQAYNHETGLLSGDTISGGGVELVAAGHLSSSDGQFSGNAYYGGTNGKAAGTVNGRFYGPAGQEIGASFGGVAPDGSIFNGAFTGQRDATPTLENLTLTNMVTKQFFYDSSARLSYTSFDDDAAEPYARSRQLGGQLEWLNADTFNYGPGESDLVSGKFTVQDKIPSSDPNFTSYHKVINDNDVYLDLYKPGAGNTELALTYASFGLWRASQHHGVVNQDDRVYLAYGIETPAGLLAAKTGTAQYTGVAYGAGGNERTGAHYEIKGTSTFAVDFGAHKLSGALALNGTSINGGASLDFGTFDFGGSIYEFSRYNLTPFAAPGYEYGSLVSRFYGPDGEEIAGSFSLVVPEGRAGVGTYIAGVAAARRP